MTEPKTHTLEAPGAVLHYDVRANDDSVLPVLLIIGSPMGADGFVTLAGHFTDRTVVTYDPRSAGRSQRTDGASETTVDEHAEISRCRSSACSSTVVARAPSVLLLRSAPRGS